MTREATERSLAKSAAHDMRAAVIRLVVERARQDVVAAEAYGCVDWFRYEASSPPQEEHTTLPLAAPGRSAGRGGASPAH